MRYLVVALALIVPIGTASAEQALAGRFKCRYVADWGCGPEPDGICIDRVLRPAPRANLDLNLDTRRMSLNGLDAALEGEDIQSGLWIHWVVGGLGNQKLTATIRDGKLIVHLQERAIPGHGYSISDFECRRAAGAGP